MVQTAFLLEKMILEYSIAAKMAFGREVCQAKLLYRVAFRKVPHVVFLDVGRWALQGPIPKRVWCGPRGLLICWPVLVLACVGRWALLGPIPKRVWSGPARPCE